MKVIKVSYTVKWKAVVRILFGITLAACNITFWSFGKSLSAKYAGKFFTKEGTDRYLESWGTCFFTIAVEFVQASLLLWWLIIGQPWEAFSVMSFPLLPLFYGVGALVSSATFFKHIGSIGITNTDLGWWFIGAVTIAYGFTLFGFFYGLVYLMKLGRKYVASLPDKFLERHENIVVV